MLGALEHVRIMSIQFGVNMAKMVALRQMYLPGTGTVQPGDVFDIDSRFVRALKGTGRARDAGLSEDVSLMPAYRQHAMQTETVRPEPAPPVSSEPSDEVASAEDQAEDPERRRAHLIAHLRTRARALGVEVDGRWSEARLKYEISQVATSGNRYERRDLVAEDT